MILKKGQKQKKKKHTQKTTKIKEKRYSEKNKMPKVQISPENKIYDGDGYLLRVACVCVRDNSENEVCNLCSFNNLFTTNLLMYFPLYRPKTKYQ